MSMPPHTHAGRSFEEMDATGLDLGGNYHLAYRFGEVGEEPFDALAPYLPLSISFGPQRLGASRHTLRYGLVHDFWQDITAPSESDYKTLWDAALRLLPEEIRAVEGGDTDRLEKRRFVRP